MQLEGKVAVIIGGGKGIGLRYARGLAAEGPSVVIAEIDAIAAERAAADLRAVGHRVLEIATDGSDETSVRAMVERSMTTFGRIDVQVNNAAMASGGFSSLQGLL